MIDILPMSDFENDDNQPAVLNIINNAILPTADPVKICAGKLEAPGGAGIGGEVLDTAGDFDLIVTGNLFEDLEDGFLDFNIIHRFQSSKF